MKEPDVFVVPVVEEQYRKLKPEKLSLWGMGDKARASFCKGDSWAVSPCIAKLQELELSVRWFLDRLAGINSKSSGGSG